MHDRPAPLARINAAHTGADAVELQIFRRVLGVLCAECGDTIVPLGGLRIIMSCERAGIKPAAHLQQGTLLRTHEHLLLGLRKVLELRPGAKLPFTGSLPRVFLQKAVIKVGLHQLQPAETMATLRAHGGVYLATDDDGHYQRQCPFEGNSPR